MRNLLLLLTLTGLATTTARAQATPATDASGVPLINRTALATNGALPAAAATGRRPALPPDQQADRQSQRLARALGLSADQQAQVRQIIFGERTNELAAQQQLPANGARRGRGRVKKAGRAQADDQLRGVLTPDQYARYQQLLTQRKQQGHARRGQAPDPNPGGGPLD